MLDAKNNPLGIKLGDKIVDFFYDNHTYIVHSFSFVNETMSLCNPITMKKFLKEGAFWAVSVLAYNEVGRFSHATLVPIDMIKKEHIG